MYFITLRQTLPILARPGRCYPFYLSSAKRLTVASGLCDKPSVPEGEKNNSFNVLQGGKKHNVNNLEKRFLVWSGKFKSINDVPRTVPQETMEKARNKMRIKIANYMILATILACVGFIYSGKQAAKRGESVQKMNMDWHKQINEGSAK